jgi:hypothetical protein
MPSSRFDVLYNRLNNCIDSIRKQAESPAVDRPIQHADGESAQDITTIRRPGKDYLSAESGSTSERHRGRTIYREVIIPAPGAFYEKSRLNPPSVQWRIFRARENSTRSGRRDHERTNSDSAARGFVRRLMARNQHRSMTRHPPTRTGTAARPKTAGQRRFRMKFQLQGWIPSKGLDTLMAPPIRTDSVDDRNFRFRVPEGP